MNKDQFFTYLENPDAIQSDTLNDLKDIMDTFPYFQTAHMLFLKGLHNNKSLKFDIQLTKSATFVPDRKKLFKLLFYSDILSDREKSNLEPSLDHNLQEVSVKESKVEEFEKPIELLDFQIQDEEGQQKKELAQPIDYSFSGDISDTSLELEYASGYNIEDLEPADEVYLSSFYTFEEWLKFMKKGGKHHEDSIAKSRKRRENGEKDHLIDNFIKEKPKIEVSEEENNATNDFSKHGLDENPDFITETLASIYIKQGYLDKAIYAYKKLSLKYPEKNSYFASQIEKLKKLIKEQ